MQNSIRHMISELEREFPPTDLARNGGGRAGHLVRQAPRRPGRGAERHQRQPATGVHRSPDRRTAAVMKPAPVIVSQVHKLAMQRARQLAGDANAKKSELLSGKGPESNSAAIPVVIL